MELKGGSIQGYMDGIEMNWLLETTAALPADAIIVEVGPWLGRSTSAICQGAVNKTVIVIDLWLGKYQDDIVVPCFDGQTLAVDISNGLDVRLTFSENMSRLGYYPAMLKMESLQAVSLFADKSIDFLFLDGTKHSVEYVTSEIKSWLPKVRGIISGHDYYTWPTTRQVVDTLFPDAKIIKAHHGIWYKEIIS